MPPRPSANHPRASVRAVVSAIDRIAAPLVYLLVAAYAVYASIVTPFHNWDAIAYIAAAESFEEGDAAALQRFAYGQFRDAVPDALYREYAQEDGLGDSMRTRYRHALRTDPVAFAELLPFYQVRPLYNLLIFLAYKAGVNIELATHLISGLAVAALMVLLYFAAAPVLIRPFFYLLPLTVVLFGGLDLARYSTPDALSLLAAALVVVLFLQRRFTALLVAVPIVLGVRTDLILFTLPLLLWLFVFERPLRARVALSALASLLVYLAVVSLAGNQGWSTFFYCSTVERCIHPISMPPTLHADVYWSVLAAGTRALLLDPRFDAYVILLVAFGVAAFALRNKLAHRDLASCVAVVCVCCAYVLGRFAVLPDQWWRFFTAPYVFTALALLILLSASLRDTRPTGTESAETPAR